MRLTNSLAEYLKIIYIISNTKDKIRVTEIAKKLGYSKPSVNRALKNLKTESLINYEAYGDIILTEKGKSIAKSIMKRYDTLKFFLTEVLEIDEAIAENEAASMKNSVSEETIVKLEQYINKILDLSDLDCNYDETSEKCKNCVRNIARKRLKIKEGKQK